MTRPTLALGIVVSCLIVFTVIAIAFWLFGSVDHIASASERAQFDLACDYAQFRKIMVRKNATQAIVNQGGMKLLESSVQDVTIDASKDDRPILNAIRGTSKTELDATKTITVRLDNSQLEAQDLTLRQQVEVQNERLSVQTESIGSQGNVQRYETTLLATPTGNRTRVVLSVDMDINVKVPRMFTGRADSRVRSAAKQALSDQQTAITDLVVTNANEAIVLPELGAMNH